ncbi:MAG: T9SS type A sorting domain-containing protein [Bacteroidetes bacterium]|nr:T9SS type A sorting domain-containing protein [Bacteroidota bacterium]
MKKVTLLAISLLFYSFIQAQTPTWSNDVAKIIYNNCSSCHHEGGIGPFTLMSYDDAVNHAGPIEVQVQSKLMPPWMPDPNYVHFKGERILSEQDINTISNWVDGGMPSGNLAEAPDAPVYNNESQMQGIDETIQWPKWTVSSNVDQYRTFVIHSNYTEDVYINQIEYLPGNGAVVHHMVLFYDPTSASYDLDQDDPLPGYESYGLGPVTYDAVIIGAWAPGSGIFEMPSNFGIRIPAGADLALEIHYSPNTLGQVDSSKVNLKFSTAPDVREVDIATPINHLDNVGNPLFIPANTVKSMTDKFYLNYTDLSLISVFPHMHLIGTEIHSWAIKNGDTTKLVSIPKWNFHWQGFYEYQKLIHIKNGSTFWGEATYDNTLNNPFNPSNPPQDVSAGEHTTDEMMIIFFAFTPYQAGDEDIILDSTLISTVPEIPLGNDLGLHVFPNPVGDEMVVGINLPYEDEVTFSLYNAAGILVKRWNQTWSSGNQSQPYSLKGITPGLYLLQTTYETGSSMVKVMKQ